MTPTHYRILIFIGLSFWFCQGFAQRVIVNSNGERIIMFPDGSWRVADAGDSVLITQNLQKSEIIGQDQSGVMPEQMRNTAEYEDYISRKWNELHFNIKSTEKKIQNEFRAATNAHFSAQEIFHNAEANKNMIEPDRFAAINEKYEQSIKTLKEAKSNQKSIKKFLEQSKKLASLPAKKLEPKLNSLQSRYNLFLSKYSGIAQTEDAKSAKTEKPESTKPKINREVKSNKTDKKISNKNPDLSAAQANLPPYARVRAYRSKPFDCAVRTDTIDEASGKRKIELQPELFFTHTDMDLRPFFKEKELITCFARLSKIDAYVYLTIDFQIASSHAQSNFGSLSNGSLLRLRLLNGEFVSLYNLRSDRGRIDPYSGYTIFTGQYALGKEEIKMLQQHQLDKVRILWSTGYEDYDVYKVDFFIDHLNCLLNR